MKGLNAMEEEYESFEILGQKALFTNNRIDRSTVPEGIYAYDLRDDGEGKISAVEPIVTVNHAGTVLCKKPIEMINGDYRAISEYDYNFLSENFMLEEFKITKPKCPLIGQNGNIFNLMGIASKTLKKNNMADEAKEMCSRITSSGSYDEALSIIDEYVEITSVDEEECEEETEDMEMEMT